MKKIALLLAVISISQYTFAQIKPHLEGVEAAAGAAYELRPLNLTINPVAVPRVQRPLHSTIRPNLQGAVLPSLERNTQMQLTRDANGHPIFIKGKSPKVRQVVDGKDTDYYGQAIQYLNEVKYDLKLKEPEEEFRLKLVETDELGQVHTRLQQFYNGIEVYGAELIVHNVAGNITHANGNYYPTPVVQDVRTRLNERQATEIAKDVVSKSTTIQELSAAERKLLLQDAISADLVIYHADRKLDAERLVWKVAVVPHIGQHWLIFVDAKTGEIIHQFDQICRLHDHLHPTHSTCTATHTNTELLDGPATANAVDLNGVTRTLNTYESSGNYFMIDASRAMFSNFQSDIIQEPRGSVWTLDAEDSSPQGGGFQVSQNFSSNNSWPNRTAVSAHYNAGVAYEYFRTTFDRNSIDGSGGTIVSIINVTDEDNRSMDNAFWHDRAMYYGNGSQAFSSPLARGLDVAGHEMSHGVVQNSANLEYYGESGALNESFADVFGVMMDRDDWNVGEDVVNTNIFRTGAMRSMSNPNNGGNRFGDVGWQPAHTSEQYFGREDNAGVHINSGITNRAFYLFASDIGKSKAEQVYYRALTKYLTRSSNFIDARLAVIQSAKDLYGATANEVSAAETAFNTVGIGNSGGGGGGGDTSGGTDLNAICILGTNPGTERVLFTDENNSALYLADSNGELLQDPLVNVAIKSKPSITDDGSFVVFVDANSALRFIDFNEGQLGFLEEDNQNPTWRNAVISKDGRLLAAITNDLSPQILIFDLETGNGQAFPLSNPTSAQGVSTGDVNYADAMEWSYDGEFLIYDALSVIPSSFGENIEYWNIGFLAAWDRNANNFGDGTILPLFGGLPDDVSIGNPTFAKNSSCVIAFDFLDANSTTIDVYGVNYETGDVGVIFEGNTPGYPSYSKLDDAVIFDFQNNGEQVLAVQGLSSDKITPSGEPFIFREGGSWGIVYSDGVRTITNTAEIGEHKVQVYPSVFNDEIHIQWEGKQEPNAQVALYDLLGRRLLIQALQADMTLSTAQLQAGAYFLKIQIGTQHSTQKLIKVE